MVLPVTISHSKTQKLEATNCGTNAAQNHNFQSMDNRSNVLAHTVSQSVHKDTDHVADGESNAKITTPGLIQNFHHASLVHH